MRRMLTLLLVLAVVAGLPGTALARVEPDARCYGLQGHGETFFDPSVGGFVGSADVRLGGELEAGVPVTVYPSADGSMSSHIFEFAQGTITTSEPIVVKPTADPFTLELLSRPVVVAGGSGAAHLLPGSTLSLADIPGVGVVPVAAAWEIRGQVCFDD